MDGFQLYWGDSHCNIRVFQEDIFDETFAEARSRLDFLPIAYYPFEHECASPFLGLAVTNDRSGSPAEVSSALGLESIGQRPLFLRQWDKVNEITRAHNDPGAFVTLPGYEWHGNRIRWGDHNVFFPEEGHPLLDTNELPDLFRQLSPVGGLAFPHHTAYRVGERGKDWSFHDPDVSPLAEIFSSHGCSESIDSPFAMSHNSNMGPRTSGGTIVDGLLKGHKFGFIASSDAHYGYAGPWGRGLMALYARELTRDGILEAIRSRRAYGVTGDRIELEFTADGAFMGREAPQGSGPVEVRWNLRCSDALDRIEILRNGRVLHVYSHRGKWRTPAGGRIKVRLETGWGPDTADGFKTPLRRWSGSLALSGGRIIAAEPCFTVKGSSVSLDKSRSSFTLTNHQRDTRTRDHTATQALVFELVCAEDGRITLNMDGAETSYSPRDLCMDEHLSVDYEGIHRIVEEQFGLAPADIPNHDVYYHNAWKHRLSRAVPEEAYAVQGAFVDESPPPGESFYYMRVIQENGQAAWSSPVWVRR
ncbi:MAG: hypothetical protein JW909_03210 [Planctomycetes bacterium]|nr:hypothetical protein [Planctomycetota bacterium]